MTSPYRPLPFRRLPAPVRALLLLLAAPALLAGCGRGEATYPITDVREQTGLGPAAPPTSLEERLGLRLAAGDDPHAGLGIGEAPEGGGGWAYEVPEGWTALPPAPMREAGWQVAGHPDAECTFSVLPAGGGGMGANVNRWRKQMSLPPIDDEELGGLPKGGTLLGRPAVRVELEGRYVGMRGEKDVPGAKLLGLIASLPQSSAYLKLTGPAAVVDAEAARFLALARSIRQGGASPHPSGMGATPPAPTPGPTAPRGAPFRWTVPAGWQTQAAKPPRLATFVPGTTKRTECIVTILPGTAGGVRENLDLWRQQSGAERLTDAEYEALDRRQILGATAWFMAVEGTYRGKGGPEQEGFMLLGMVLPRAQDSVFVKMTGPTDEVRGQQDAFRSFCESFHE